MLGDRRRSSPTRSSSPTSLLTALILVLVLAPASGTHRARLPQRVLAWRPLAWLGLISYGVYLWHLTIAELLILPESPHALRRRPASTS